MVAPAVSVIIPCRNEGGRILSTLDDLAAQRVDRPFEVVVADGSDDDTRSRLLQRAAQGGDPFQLRIVENPRRTIPAGLNRAVAASTGALIIRIDAHARLDADYVREMSGHLLTPGIDLAGPQIFATPGRTALMAQIISWCQNTRLGNGGTSARNRLEAPRRVEHSPMSCYRREVWEALGGYDEELLSNEDFEFDWRAHTAGLGVWSVPAPRYRILARGDLPALAAQRWRYGRWKAAVIWKHPRSLRPRQALPPLALVAGMLAILAGILGAIPWWWFLAVAVVIPVVLASLLHAHRLPAEHPAQLRLPPVRIPEALVYACAVYTVIHVGWAAGFWYGIMRGPVCRHEGGSMPKDGAV